MVRGVGIGFAKTKRLRLSKTSPSSGVCWSGWPRPRARPLCVIPTSEFARRWRAAFVNS